VFKKYQRRHFRSRFVVRFNCNKENLITKTNKQANKQTKATISPSPLKSSNSSNSAKPKEINCFPTIASKIVE